MPCSFQYRKSQNGIIHYVHFDVRGHIKESSMGGSMYLVSSIDYYYRKVWVYFLKQNI